MSKYGDISAADIIESLGREKEVTVSRPKYRCGFALWLISILAVPFAYLVSGATIPLAIALFVLTVALAAWVGLFSGGIPYRLEKPEGILDWVNTIVFYASILVFALSFLVSVNSGGNPRIVDGVYAIVSGGKVVKQIDEATFNFYRSARGAMLSILTVFNCLQFGFIRKHTVW